MTLCVCDQVPGGSALADFKSTRQTCHSVRAGETDGVETDRKDTLEIKL